MTAFQVGVLMLGLFALIVSANVGQNMVKTLGRHLERSELTQTETLVALMSIQEELRAIQESLHILDNK